jgi:NAD-dependent deacetylase
MDISPEIIRRLARARFVTVLTGAGVSAESGVPTFRGVGGLWRQHRPEELATPAAFARDPQLVWEWYEWRRSLIREADPNEGHHAIVEIERIYPEFLLITQNVDNLHRRAGSKNIVELHGNIFRYRCAGCGARIDEEPGDPDSVPPRCECGAYWRPDVVWFGESLPEMALSQAFRAAHRCDVMLSVGTSAVVHPAASLPVIAHEAGALLIEVNPDSTPISPLADACLTGPSATILPELVDLITKELGSS